MARRENMIELFKYSDSYIWVRDLVLQKDSLHLEAKLLEFESILVSKNSSLLKHSWVFCAYKKIVYIF